ncbi:hypothetical protein KRM28CT15_63160 [Krasilnikovia sp. M28-CT-15]
MRRLLVAIGVSVAVLMSPGVASAASEQSFQSDALRNDTYLVSRGTNRAAGVFSLFGRASAWSVQDKGMINGHHKVKLVDASKVGNYVVFKSYGAFTKQHAHVCVKAPTGLNPDHTNKVTLATCDTNSRYQRWF